MRANKIVAFIVLPILVATVGCSDSNDNAINLQGNSPVTLANLNILHGFNCDPPTPADGDQCRIRGRVALLREHLIAQGCPDIVTLQEIVNKEFVLRSPTEQVGPLESVVSLIEAELPNLAASCGFTYQIVYRPFLPAAVAETDEELILSRYPVLQTDIHLLHSALYDVPNGFMLFARHILYARIDHPSGEVDVYTTHLSSSSDAATNSCDSFRELLPDSDIGPRIDCPIECDVNDTVRACQAEQLALYVEQTQGANNLALISGDFNAKPGSSEYLAMTSRGWLDSHVATGQAECDSATGIGCTSGRESSTQAIENPALNVNSRIDYIFVALPQSDNGCVASIESQLSGTFKIASAGLFAAAPNPFVATCGSSPNSVCWASDHSGNQAQLICSRP